MAYIIMGGGGGSSEISNVKYDPEDDKLYLYDGETWHYWRRGGLQTLWLYENGTDYTEVTGGWTTTGTLVSMNAGGTIHVQNFGKRYLRNNYLIDSGGHTKFHVSYQEYDYAGSMTFRLKDSAGNVLYSKTHSHSQAAWKWTSGVWDVGISLANHAGGTVKVYFEVAHTGDYNSQIKVSDIRFYTPEN